MSKDISCGVLITDGKYLLGCLPTGRVFKERNCLDLPKGKKDANESSYDCAVRELKEETGLVPKPGDLKPLGRFNYRPTKDLELFMWKVDKMPSIKDLHCDSQFEDHQGVMRTEHCGYEHVPIQDVKKRFFPSLNGIITNILA